MFRVQSADYRLQIVDLLNATSNSFILIVPLRQGGTSAKRGGGG